STARYARAQSNAINSVPHPEPRQGAAGRVSKDAEHRCRKTLTRRMSQLPPAILFDLDDTILSAFGQAEGQWQRVVAELIEHPAPHPPDDIVTAIQAYSRYLWADQTRHKHWRHRIGEARRHIVQNAFA